MKHYWTNDSYFRWRPFFTIGLNAELNAFGPSMTIGFGLIRIVLYAMDYRDPELGWDWDVSLETPLFTLGGSWHT